MSQHDLFFIVLAAVIFGGVIVAFSTAAIIRYSRHEDAGNTKYRQAWRDLGIPLMAAAFCLYGMWRAGLFG